MTDFELKLKQGEFVGIVEDNNDPDKKQRVRIRIPYLHGDANHIPTDAIPWAQPIRDNNGLTFSVPDINKVVNVTFPTGNLYFPVYNNAEHLNINLQKKIESYSGDDYTKFISFCYNHNTQMFIDKDAFNIFHKFNGMSISDEDVTLITKDRQSNIFLGNRDADQSIILGDHFFTWLSNFLTTLQTNAYICASPGSPAIASPDLIKTISEFSMKKSKFLSKTIKAIENSNTTINKLDVEGLVGDNVELIQPESAASDANGTTQNGKLKVTVEPINIPKEQLNIVSDSDPKAYIDPDDIENIPTSNEPDVENEEDAALEKAMEIVDKTDDNLTPEEKQIYKKDQGDGFTYLLSDEYDPTASTYSYNSSSNRSSFSSTPTTKLEWNGKKFKAPPNGTHADPTYILYLDADKLPFPKITKESFIKYVQNKEGGLSNISKDSASKYPCPTTINGVGGYHTNKGVTYKVWVAKYGKNKDTRFLTMDDSDWMFHFNQFYKCGSVLNAKPKTIAMRCLYTHVCWAGGGKALNYVINHTEDLLGGKKINDVEEKYAIAAFISAHAQYLINLSNQESHDIFRQGWIHNATNKLVSMTYFGLFH